MAKLLCMGELLIDFTPMKSPEDGRLMFVRNPGGAPANVAVQTRRAGVSAGFLGSVGSDMFGDFLRDTLRECGVETDGLTQSPDYATSLAFVQLDENGDRNFSFYRNPGADTRLSYDSVDLRLIDECEVFCFGSLLLTAEPSRSTVKKLVDYARAQGKVIAYDPNWRPTLWHSEAEGVEAMRSLIDKADIIKVSEEELAMLTGQEDIRSGGRALLDAGVSMAVVTMGPEGCAVFTPRFILRKNTYDTAVVDTTGSGDSFFGALLAKLILSGKPLGELTEEELADFVDFANAAGAVCASKKGAIPALPDVAAIERCRRTSPLLIE